MSGCEDCPIPQSLSHAAPITEEGSAVRMVLTNDLGLRMRDLSVLCLTTSRNTLPGGAGERNKPDSLPPAMTMSMACNKPRYPHAHCRRAWASYSDLDRHEQGVASKPWIPHGAV